MKRRREISWFYWVGRGIGRLLLWSLTRWEITGKDNVPRDGALLVVANHVNLADPPLLAASIDRKAMIMAKQELFHYPVVSYFLRNLGAFSIRRGQLDRQAIRQSLQILSEGMALIVFPEGMRSRSGQLRPAFHGAARLACLSGAQILPVGIIGTGKLKGPTWLVRRPRITVNIGRPFTLSPGSKLTKTELAAHTTSIMRHIAEMLPPEYHGVYKT